MENNEMKNLFKKLQDEAKRFTALRKKQEEERKPKGDQIKLKATSNLSAVYKLPYSTGQEFSISASQAKELIVNKDAVELKVKKKTS
jgi:hypothetical protein